MSLSRCTRCEGFVPPGVTSCPNCRSSRGAWWKAPMALAGAGLATVTLSACYGPACTARVTLPDGTTDDAYVPYGSRSCGGNYDCRVALPDGGDPKNDSEWNSLCGRSGHQVDAGSKDGG